ncbi:sigma-70 family RNA polymerase sigma factor [Ornithinimicrobium avium]|uniref:Uncharacterized protein n=1 Tax=Ornithinimicrobium avium TaxID=2283195 RepID=A0A345NKA2_9MICO|nr:hypothetical protein [Ornithinimicrobium avium]AXH95460.1 hypothetical protein DV701_04340 [Ornithinimicrobium avium]
MGQVGDEEWSDSVMDAAWRVSASSRRGRHRGASQAGCPASSPPGVEGRRPLTECARTGCTDVFHDLAAGVVGRLRLARVETSPGWLVTVARNELVDQHRAARARRGLPARPTRSDGDVSTVEDALRALATGARERRWLLALFRMMRAHAARVDRLSSGWPIESWAGEKSGLLGGVSVHPADVTADVRRVLDVAAGSVGAAWVHRRLLLPLTTIRADGVDAETVLSGTSVEDLAVLALVARSFRSDRAAGRSVQQAWREALRSVGAPPGTTPQAWAVELLERWGAA